MAFDNISSKNGFLGRGNLKRKSIGIGERERERGRDRDRERIKGIIVSEKEEEHFRGNYI